MPLNDYLENGKISRHAKVKLRKLTPVEANQSVQLSSLKGSDGALGELILSIEITSVMDLHGIRNDAMVEAIVDEVMDQWWFYKLDEILLAIRNGKRGKYGKDWHKFSGKVLNDWICEYDIEKMTWCESVHGQSEIRKRNQQKAYATKRISDTDHELIQKIDEYKLDQP